MIFKKLLKVIFSLIFIVAVVLLCFSGPFKALEGSPEYFVGSAKVELTSGIFPCETKTLNTVVTARDIAMLDYFPNLISADFSGSSCYEEISRWASQHPEVDVRYTVPMPDGSKLDNKTEALDLSQTESAQLPAVAEAAATYYHDTVIPAMNTLRFHADVLEANTDKSCWPYPTYSDLLYY